MLIHWRTGRYFVKYIQYLHLSPTPLLTYPPLTLMPLTGSDSCTCPERLPQPCPPSPMPHSAAGLPPCHFNLHTHPHLFYHIYIIYIYIYIYIYIHTHIYIYIYILLYICFTSYHSINLTFYIILLLSSSYFNYHYYFINFTT